MTTAMSHVISGTHGAGHPAITSILSEQTQLGVFAQTTSHVKQVRMSAHCRHKMRPSAWLYTALRNPDPNPENYHTRYAWSAKSPNQFCRVFF